MKATVASANLSIETIWINSTNPAVQSAHSGEGDATFATLLQSSEGQGEWCTVAKRRDKPTIRSRKIIGKGEALLGLKLRRHLL